MVRIRAMARGTSVVFSSPRSPRDLATHMMATAMKSRATIAVVQSPTNSAVAQRREYWRWVACLLFSGEARKGIQEIVFTSDSIAADDIVGVQEVLQTRDPLKHVFASSRLAREASTESPRWVSATRFYLDRPDIKISKRTGAKKAELRFERRPEPLTARVVGTATDYAGSIYWVVLYPDDGVAWVRPTDCKIVDNGDGPCSQREQPYVCIDHFSDANRDSSLLFLQMMGERVENLMVKGHGDVSEWCQEALKACPALKKLELQSGVTVRNLRVFVSASSEGLCHVNTLAIADPCDVESGGVKELLTVLCDASHPLARCLQGLIASIRVPSEASTSFVECVQRLLLINRRLNSIYLTLIGAGGRGLESLRDHSTVRAGPLAISSKISFLKALAMSRNSAFGCIDASVVTRIFEFAAPHRPRSFLCLCRND